MHSPQRYLESCLETFGSGGRNNLRSGSGKHVSNEFDGLAHHIGEACSKAWVFKRPNGSSQCYQVFRGHAHQVQFNWQRSVSIAWGNRIQIVSYDKFNSRRRPKFCVAWSSAAAQPDSLRRQGH